MNKFLQKLAKCKKRKQLIEKASKKELNSIRNVCYNVCKGNIKLPPDVYKKIFPYRKDIRDLGNKKKLKTKQTLKRRLVQRGGFLPALLPIVLSLVSSLGAKALGI